MILLVDDIFMIMIFCPPPSDASVSAMSVMIAGRAGVGTKYKSHSQHWLEWTPQLSYLTPVSLHQSTNNH